MAIYDEQGNIVENPDLNAGYIKYETVVIAHHPAEPAKPAEPAVIETEVLWQNPNDPNNKLTQDKIVEEAKPAQPAKEAWDETEDREIYVPYTEEELAEQQRQQEEAEEAAAAAKAKQEAIDALPERVDNIDDHLLDVDESVVTLYELMIDTMSL